MGSERYSTLPDRENGGTQTPGSLRAPGLESLPGPIGACAALPSVPGVVAGTSASRQTSPPDASRLAGAAQENL